MVKHNCFFIHKINVVLTLNINILVLNQTLRFTNKNKFENGLLYYIYIFVNFFLLKYF